MNLFPIRTLAEQTGVSSITLRAWERRHGLLKPQRSPKGHRLYSQQDIDLIKKIVGLLQQGHSISEAANRIRHGTTATTGILSPAGSDWKKLQHDMLHQISQFNEDALDNLYNQALSLYPVDLVTEQAILPVLKTLGSSWIQRDTGIAEEHFFSAYLRNKLGARLHHESRRARGPRLLAACLPDEHHELGLLLFCLAALSRGYRITYFGADTPLFQIPQVALLTQAVGVVLSGTSIKARNALQQSLYETKKQLAIPVLLGGDFSERHRQFIEATGVIALGAQQSDALQLLEQHTGPDK